MQFKKVKMFKWVTPTAGPLRKEKCGEGKFLKFSTSGEVIDSATEVYSSALVLTPDGSVVETPTSLIQFSECDYEAL